MYNQIRVAGHLHQRWSDWFDGLTSVQQPNGETVLAGMVPDQSALFGLLNKVRDLGLTVIAVNRGQIDHVTDC